MDIFILYEYYNIFILSNVLCHYVNYNMYNNGLRKCEVLNFLIEILKYIYTYNDNTNNTVQIKCVGIIKK